VTSSLLTIRHHSMIISGSPYSTGLRVSDQNLDHRAGTWRRNLIHRLHCLDDDEVSPILTWLPISTNGRAPGAAPR